MAVDGAGCTCLRRAPGTTRAGEDNRSCGHRARARVLATGRPRRKRRNRQTDVVSDADEEDGGRPPLGEAQKQAVAAAARSAVELPQPESTTPRDER